MKTIWSIAVWLVVATSLLVTAAQPAGVSPALVYSTYLGSSGADGPNSWLKRFSLAESGSVYFAQSTYEADFPTTADAYSKGFNGGSEQWGKEDLAVVEFNTRQNALKYASYFGGTTGPDFVTQVLRHKNSVYLAGNTGLGDLFVTKLTPTGDRILFSTFLGGTQDEDPPSICLDAADNIMVYASTTSGDLPVTANALDRSLTGKKDAFLAKLSKDGKQLLYLSYLGGNEKVGEAAANIVVSTNGDIYVSSGTDAADFPVTPNATQSTVKGGVDIFISVFDRSLTRLKFSTFLGGSGNEGGTIAVDDSGDITGVGATTSADFPTTPGAYSSGLKGRSDHVIYTISMTGRPRQGQPSKAVRPPTGSASGT